MPEGVIVISTRMYIESVDASGLTEMVKHVERASAKIPRNRAPQCHPHGGYCGSIQRREHNSTSN